MSAPDFSRAEYVTEPAIEGEVVGGPTRAQQAAGAAFPMAVLFGAVAAVIGSIVYALVASLGFMVSIVAIGIAWLIVKAMMTASKGYGGRLYQIAAVIMTYFAVSWGEVLNPVWRAHQAGAPLTILFSSRVWIAAILGPFLQLRYGLNGIIGLVILFIGLRTAWKMGRGVPGLAGN